MVFDLPAARQIESQVETIRMKHQLQGTDTVLSQAHHLAERLRGKLLEFGNVGEGGDHSVPVVIGVGIKDYVGPLAAMDYVCASIVVLLGLIAEDAALGLLLGDVLRRQGAPKPFHAASFRLTRRE